MNVIDDYKKEHGLDQIHYDYEGETQLYLYDLAKEMVKQQKPISKKKLNECLSEIANWVVECYYLLLMNPDLRQYVFMVVPEYDFGEVENLIEIIKSELLDILEARGEIIDIDMTNNDKRICEFWIKDKFDKQIRMYQLCDYTEQTIVFGEEE